MDVTIPHWSTEKEGEVGDLVAVVTNSSDVGARTSCDPTTPTEVYIGILSKIYGSEKTLHNTIKLNLTSKGRYSTQFVSNYKTNNPAWKLDKKQMLTVRNEDDQNVFRIDTNSAEEFYNIIMKKCVAKTPH